MCEHFGFAVCLNKHLDLIQKCNQITSKTTNHCQNPVIWTQTLAVYLFHMEFKNNIYV